MDLVLEQKARKRFTFPSVAVSLVIFVILHGCDHATVTATTLLYQEDGFARGSGSAVDIEFKPKNSSARLGIALCKDKLLSECFGFNVFGHSGGKLAYFFYKFGPNEQPRSRRQQQPQQDADVEAGQGAGRGRSSRTSQPQSQDSGLATPAQPRTPAAEQFQKELEELGTLVGNLTSTIQDTLDGLREVQGLYDEALDSLDALLAWVPGRRKQLPYSVIRSEWEIDNLDVWSPVKLYKFTLSRSGSGELRLSVAGQHRSQAGRVAFRVPDDYQFLSLGTRLQEANIGVLPH